MDGWMDRCFLKVVFFPFSKIQMRADSMINGAAGLTAGFPFEQLGAKLAVVGSLPQSLMRGGGIAQARE